MPLHPPPLIAQKTQTRSSSALQDQSHSPPKKLIKSLKSLRWNAVALKRQTRTTAATEENRTAKIMLIKKKYMGDSTSFQSFSTCLICAEVSVTTFFSAPKFISGQRIWNDCKREDQACPTSFLTGIFLQLK